ncbi:HetZ-related protein 2 [Oscillatoria sp. FACHB-1407]|uniref:HetZ-related protein 2 n=1 Tax=Oscillatoria sp. FACHB-1407 TaxID=2692847 RepID=UPI001683769A|nr:HetZ-related protein 2 [Oscillatoria sp. FACHB-1407]MBD2464038.1 HetZ-related protein 2 [Oscillatoria sp. FACHB-1407]
MALAEELTRDWRSRLQTDCSDQPTAAQDAIVQWLIGEDRERFDGLAPTQLAVLQQAMDYRYRILRQRYLGVPPEKAYSKLIQRLSSLFLIRSKIRTWVALSRDRQRSVTDVLKEVIQELIQSDSYIRQQMTWIAQCTMNPRLRNALLLTSIEEYCLRPIRNQPLLVYRFVNHLRRTSRGGMTQVPTGELVRLVSEEITPDEADNPVSLLDNQAVTKYQDEQLLEEQQGLRNTVKDSFVTYLTEKVGPEAGEWLLLHLQGKSQEAIAQALNMPIKQVYRLREKISYHAINVFASKHPKSSLVTAWLGTSLQEHSLGLTPEQWQQFLKTCTPIQQQLIAEMKAGKTVEVIAQELNMKANQIAGEWSKLYLSAQELRNTP